jgi:hypothetical protein
MRVIFDKAVEDPVQYTGKNNENLIEIATHKCCAPLSKLFCKYNCCISVMFDKGVNGPAHTKTQQIKGRAKSKEDRISF